MAVPSSLFAGSANLYHALAHGLPLAFALAIIRPRKAMKLSESVPRSVSDYMRRQGKKGGARRAETTTYAQRREWGKAGAAVQRRRTKPRKPRKQRQK